MDDTQKVSLATFVSARLGEKEMIARAAIKAAGEDHARWRLLGAMVVSADDPDWAILAETLEEIASHIALNDPARALREVAFKRALITEIEAVHKLTELTGGKPDPYRDWILRNLAAVDSDHPDYRPEWKP